MNCNKKHVHVVKIKIPQKSNYLRKTRKPVRVNNNTLKELNYNMIDRWSSAKSWFKTADTHTRIRVKVFTSKFCVSNCIDFLASFP